MATSIDDDGYGAPQNGAQLSFDEIADVLGITAQEAWVSYRSGMGKLKRMKRSQKIELMRRLMQAKEHGRERTFGKGEVF